MTDEMLSIIEACASAPGSRLLQAASPAQLQICGPYRATEQTIDWHRAVLLAQPGSRWPGPGDAPHVGERIAALLSALEFGPRAQALVLPGVIKLAQAQLSALLVAHPALLLPELRVHVEHSSVHRGNVTLAKAIAMSSHARFPMRRDGIPVEQLRAFAAHPAARAGIATIASARKGDMEIFIDRAPLITSAIYSRSNARAGVLASLHELGEQLHAAPGGELLAQHTFVQPLWDAAARRVSIHLPPQRLADYYACAFLEACGARGDDEFPEFLDALRAGAVAARVQMLQGLAPETDEALFPEFGPGAGSLMPAARVRHLVHGLVAVGTHAEPGSAARWLLQSLGARTPGRLPKASTGQALSYMEALAEHGVELLREDLGGRVEAGSTWADALVAAQAAREMTTRISAHTRSVVDGSQGDGTAPARRRPRV